MTNIDDVRDKLNSTIDEQADTIARQEMELAEARQENSQMARMLAEPSEVKADAEALRALAEWGAEDVRSVRLRKHPDGWYVWLYEYEERVIERVSGATLASAIMDALGNVGK